MYSRDRELSLSNNPRIELMLDMINGLGLHNKNIIDIGCHDGTLLSLIKNKDNNLYGIEANDYGVREAMKKGIKVKNFFFDDKTRIPFKNDFFDIVIAGEIIEHIYDTDFFLDEIYRLLKKRGWLILSTPNLASLGRRLMLLMGKNPLIELSPNESTSAGHIRYFVKKTLFDLLNKHNFKVAEAKYDLINFDIQGSFKTEFLAKFFPTLCRTLIVKCQKL